LWDVFNLQDGNADEDDEGAFDDVVEDDDGVGEEQPALFTATLSKLRLIAKVLSFCSTQIRCVSSAVHSLRTTSENANV
jgi:predicted sulfurtransferase